MNKPRYIYTYTLAEHKTTHLDFIYEPLGSVLHPLHLLGLGDLLVAGRVIPALAPYINVLATITGTPLDFLHFIIRGRLGLLALCATPSHGNGSPWTLTPARGALQRGSLRRGWSWGPLFFSRRGDGTLSSSSTTLLGGGVPAVSSPLVGVLALALSWAGSSSATSATATTAGRSTSCSRTVCSAALSSETAGSVVLKPATLPGSTSEAALQRRVNANYHTDIKLQKKREQRDTF